MQALKLHGKETGKTIGGRISAKFFPAVKHQPVVIPIALGRMGILIAGYLKFNFLIVTF